MDERPKVGVGVIVMKDNKILMGKRKGNHGNGTWSFPGGHLEFNESIEDCAKREIFEETGLKVKNIVRKTFTNDIFLNEKKHFVTIFVKCDYESGELEICEPDKCEKWEWFSINELPNPLFLPIENLLKQGINPFE